MSRGSPPRVRGKLADFSELFHAVRITPACAGKTLVRLSLSTRIKDHPRVCGENTNGLDEYIEGKGSPPRVRGKLLRIQHIRQRGGITPACAGKTLRV